MIVDAHNHALLTNARTKDSVFPAVDMTHLVSGMVAGGVVAMGLIVGGTVSFPVRQSPSCWQGTVDGLQRFWKGLETCEHDCLVIQHPRDVDQLSAETPGVLLGIEGWDCCLDAPTASPDEALREFAQRGVRSVQPLGRQDSVAFRTAGPPHEDLSLSETGKALIRTARNLGMVVDVSHLSGDEPAFYEIVERADTAVIASHGVCRACSPLSAALSDDALRALAGSGGVVGIHAGTRWLAGESRRATVDDVLRHMEHVIELVGLDHVAIGTDLVDVRVLPIDLPDHLFLEGLESLATMEILSDAVRSLRLTTDEREQVLSRNVLRVWRNALGPVSRSELP